MNPYVIADRPVCILVIDDDANNKELLRVILESEGVRVHTAGTGEEGLSIVEEVAPDLILLDIMMPGLSGYEVATALKAAPATQKIPVVMLTAMNDAASRAQGILAGADDFLTKPIDRGDLCTRVSALLRV